MRLDHNPFFRKVVIPWHDSDLFCMIMSVLMALVFSFSRVGIRIASEVEDYHSHGWVPMLLMILSGIVLAANIIRILTRMVRRRDEEEE
jgi:hypothetical protein